MPAFTRRSPGKYQVHQAMVGPFASLDEAEKAAAAPRRNGIRRREAVCRRVASGRTAQRAASRRFRGISACCSWAHPIACRSSLNCSRSRGRSPRRDRTRRHSRSMLARCRAPAQPQQWSAPDGVHLLHTVSIESVAAQGGLNYVEHAWRCRSLRRPTCDPKAAVSTST